LATGMIGNVVTAHSRQALGAQRGGIDYGDLAADAFGNALGNAAAGRLDRRARARQFMAAWRNLPLEEQLKWLSMSFYDAGSFSGDAPSGASPLGEAPMAGTVSERLSDVKGRPAAFEQAARERVSRQQVVSDLRQRGLPDSITVNVADDADYSEFISAYGDYGTQPAGASEFDRITVMGSSTGTELPAIENLYTPYQGWWMDKYSTFTAMLDDPSGGWRQKAGALAGGMLTVIPTMAESLIKGVYDAPNNASLAGQKWGQAGQLKGHDSALAYLEGGQYFLGAFQGLGDAVTLGTVSSARPSVPGLAPAVVVERVGRASSTVDVAAASRSWKTFADNDIFTARTDWSATRPRGTGQTYSLIQRNDIEWGLVRTNGPADFVGRTNAEAAARGFAPELADGNFATLHHIGQDSRGALIEASTRYHGVGKPGQNVLHSLYGRNEPNPFYPIDRRAFSVDTREYWQWRWKNPN
ncbi:hypothetical protein EBB59_13175, partial [Lysobacter pythonis]